MVRDDAHMHPALAAHACDAEGKILPARGACQLKHDLKLFLEGPWEVQPEATIVAAPMSGCWSSTITHCSFAAFSARRDQYRCTRRLDRVALYIAKIENLN